MRRYYGHNEELQDGVSEEELISKCRLFYF